MGMTLAQKIIKNHLLSGKMIPGEEIALRIDQTLTQDATGTMAYLEFETMGVERVRTELSVAYIDHNTLQCGFENADDHRYIQSVARKHGIRFSRPGNGICHQVHLERFGVPGKTLIGSDSHTRYGALGTMAMGEGGPELVKQLLGRTYDIPMPEVVAIYLTGKPIDGVGPQDVALAIIGEVFDRGLVKNKVMEFVGPGVANLSVDFRIGVDVMTTETTCLSSIWVTDDKVSEYYDIHGRSDAYKELLPGEVAYYDSAIEIDLSEIRPMIAMPFHPSNTYTIAELKANLLDILHDTEERAKVSLDGQVDFKLTDKVVDKKLYVDQGIIAGCAGGGFENIAAAADIIRGKSIGPDEFTLSVYPASTPIYMELVKNGTVADLMETGAIVKTAFCGPCFGAGDTPGNNGFSIRHSTRNFPNREGSKLQSGQIASVALMDARSIAATAANRGFLTGADEIDTSYSHPKYFFDKKIYENRVFDSHGKADPAVEVRFGPNIKDWPAMSPLPQNLFLKVVSEIHDPVTTTDELIPSGETSSYRSNPLGLAEFTLSRKDPAYVGRAKEVQKIQKEIEADRCPGHVSEEFHQVMHRVKEAYPDVNRGNIGVGSTIFARKPGDGSAREQAASCQKVLGGWANIAFEYATKRYRSNLINWGMLPLLIPEGELPFSNGDYIFIPDIRLAVSEKRGQIPAYVVGEDGLSEFTVTMGELTDAEREIIMEGCLINYYRSGK